MRLVPSLVSILVVAAAAAPASADRDWHNGPPRSANGIWQWRAGQGRFSGRLFFVQDGDLVRGAVLDSNTGARGELDGRVEGRRLRFHRRFTDGGRVHELDYTVTLTAGGAQMQGNVIERGGRGGSDFQATRVFPAPGPTPPPPVVSQTDVPPPPPLPRPRATPIDADTLHQLLQAIDAESFTENRLSVLKQAAGFHYFTIEQVARILPMFTFEEAKLEVLTLLRPRILDPQNGFKLDAQFFSSSAKQRAQRILAPH